MRDPVAAKFGATAFNCPNPACGAFAQQRWYETFGVEQTGAQLQSDIQARKFRIAQQDPAVAALLTDQLWSVGELTLPKVIVSNIAMQGLIVSLCTSCKKCALWVGETLVFPESITAQPHAEMPQNVQADFLEAASIASRSPRGAAGLLRLCVQKLVNGLVDGGDDLNKKIGTLVNRGLDVRIQQALDSVRVIGNEAVHPGDMSYFDNASTVSTLFALVNLIVETQIAQPKAIEALYKTLPAGKLEGIEKRDASTTPRDPPAN